MSAIYEANDYESQFESDRASTNRPSGENPRGDLRESSRRDLRGNPTVSSQFTEQLAPQASKIGRGPIPHDPRKYKYDVVAGRQRVAEFSVTRDDRMPAHEAGAMLHEIHKMFGVENEPESFLQGFDQALFFAHTVNSGSVLVPGRSKFVVDGAEFDYGLVRDKLGVDMRRFFRAYADDIVEVNRAVLRDYDPYNVVSAEKWGWITQVAHERGLHRYPHLAHDSADACTRITPSERMALSASRQLVVGSTVNAIDRMRANNRVLSADNYDSTNGVSVAASLH